MHATAKCDSPEVGPNSMAATLSLDEEERALGDERGLVRDDGLIAWGVDGYPGNLAAFEAFDVG